MTNNDPIEISMMTKQLTAREIQITSRWTEVNVKKLIKHMDDNPHSIDYSLHYVYEDTISIVIEFVKQCRFDDQWVMCNDSCRVNIRYIPQVKCYLGLYENDSFFNITFEGEDELPKITRAFEIFKTPFMLCACERLGRDHLDPAEKGKCNNCYIWGMVRGEDCSICMMDDGKPWIETSCKHYFHELCWGRIFKDRHGARKCPLCRTEQEEVKRL